MEEAITVYLCCTNGLKQKTVVGGSEQSASRSRQAGTIHPLYLYSAMSDMSFVLKVGAGGLALSHIKKAGPTAMEADWQ
jgi:hypothetical protein